MANNRMWLIHRPTKLGIMLGKRMGWGWYAPPNPSRVASFYEYLEHNPEGSQDHFILAFEVSREGGFTDWEYLGHDEKTGFAKFKLLDEDS